MQGDVAHLVTGCDSATHQRDTHRHTQVHRYDNTTLQHTTCHRLAPGNRRGTKQQTNQHTTACPRVACNQHMCSKPLRLLMVQTHTTTQLRLHCGGRATVVRTDTAVGGHQCMHQCTGQAARHPLDWQSRLRVSRATRPAHCLCCLAHSPAARQSVKQLRGT